MGDERNNRTVKQIAETVRQYLPGSEIMMRPDAPADRRDYRINCRSIRIVLDWKSRLSIEQGIEEVIELFSNPTSYSSRSNTVIMLYPTHKPARLVQERASGFLIGCALLASELKTLETSMKASDQFKISAVHYSIDLFERRAVTGFCGGSRL